MSCERLIFVLLPYQTFLFTRDTFLLSFVLVWSAVYRLQHFPFLNSYFPLFPFALLLLLAGVKKFISSSFKLFIIRPLLGHVFSSTMQVCFSQNLTQCHFLDQFSFKSARCLSFFSRKFTWLVTPSLICSASWPLLLFYTYQLRIILILFFPSAGYRTSLLVGGNWLFPVVLHFVTPMLPSTITPNVSVSLICFLI